jgi:hypothetical protein
MHRNHFPTIICLVALTLGPIMVLGGLELMPDCAGDPRLNNYFLENIYLFLKGKSDSLWHLGFYYPYPYVLGFSDNLFGASPIYLMARILGGEPETAFQVWFLAAYPLNFYSAYFVLRRWGHSKLAATGGALVFAFSLPVTAFEGHAQLHYRFPVPLAIAALSRFLQTRSVFALTAAFGWVVWQFYLSIYIAFFTLMLLAAMCIVEVITKWPGLQEGLARLRLFKACILEPLSMRALMTWSALFAVLALLLFPYLEVSSLYHAKRGYQEISSLLPRLTSYLYTDISVLWSLPEQLRPRVDAPWEHQLFIGLIPAVLFVFGAIRCLGNKDQYPQALRLFWAWVLLFLTTLSVADLSLWKYVSVLPLASAIRAVTRIELVLLFPIATLCAAALEKRSDTKPRIQGAISGLILFFLLAECLLVHPPTSAKQEWQQRRLEKAALVPGRLPDQAILMFAQPENQPLSYFDEIDAMWAALETEHKTMNGYSGLQPPSYSTIYGTDCKEIPKRILAFLDFQNANDAAHYLAYMQRVVPIGFQNCDPLWWTRPLHRSERKNEYPDGFFGNIRLNQQKTEVTPSGIKVIVSVHNLNSQETLSVGGPNAVLLSWRWLAPDGTPISGWDYRQALAFDIPAGSQLDQGLLVATSDQPAKSGRLEISLVHENVAWAQDRGLKPLRINLGEIYHPPPTQGP